MSVELVTVVGIRKNMFGLADRNGTPFATKLVLPSTVSRTAGRLVCQRIVMDCPKQLIIPRVKISAMDVFFINQGQVSGLSA